MMSFYQPMTVDSMISKLEEALAGLEDAFAGVWSYLLPDAKICMGELELIREVIKALEERAAEGLGGASAPC